MSKDTQPVSSMTQLFGNSLTHCINMGPAFTFQGVLACNMLFISSLICLVNGEPLFVKASIGESITIPCEGMGNVIDSGVKTHYAMFKEGEGKLGYCATPLPVHEDNCNTLGRDNMEWESRLNGNQRWEVYFRISALEAHSVGRYVCTKTVMLNDELLTYENHTIIDVRPDIVISMTVNNHVFKIDDTTQQCATIPSNITCSAQNYLHVHAGIYLDNKRLNLDRLLVTNSSQNSSAKFFVACCTEFDECSTFGFEICPNTYNILAFKPLKRYKVSGASYAEILLTAAIDMPCPSVPISNSIVKAFKRSEQEMLILHYLRIFISMLSLLCLIFSSIIIAAGVAKYRSRQPPVNLWIAQPINSEISDNEQDPSNSIPGHGLELAGRASINKGFRLREWPRADFYGEREGM